MSDSLLENTPSTTITMRTIQKTCPNLANQQVKQPLCSYSVSGRSSEHNNEKISLADSNNIYAITNQIQQRSIDQNKQPYFYMNDDAILEEFQKLDIRQDSIHTRTASTSFLNKLDITLNRINNQQQSNSINEQKIAQLENEIEQWKQKYVNLFSNILSSDDNLKQHLSTFMKLQMDQQINPQTVSNPMNGKCNLETQMEISSHIEEQLLHSNQRNNELLYKHQSQMRENEELKAQIAELQQKMQKQQMLIGAPILRQTQIREEVRKEVEDRLINKHKLEFNVIITKFSREKAMMIKTIELQRLRILDNERIMFQMEGDLENIRESYQSIYLKNQCYQKKVETNSFEIPEEPTLNKSEQFDNIIENQKKKSSPSSVLSQQLQSPSSQQNSYINKMMAGHSRKNKSFENHFTTNAKYHLTTSSLSGRSLHSNSNTNLPSSQASSGRNHHQKFASIAIAQPKYSVKSNKNLNTSSTSSKKMTIQELNEQGPMVYNSDNSVYIFNRFKNSVDSISQY